MLTTVVGIIIALAVTPVIAYEIYALVTYRTKAEAECTEIREIISGKGKHKKTTYQAVFHFSQGEQGEESSLNREVSPNEFKVGNTYPVWFRSKKPSVCVESRRKIVATLAMLCVVEIAMITFVMHMYSAADLANTLMHLN